MYILKLIFFMVSIIFIISCTSPRQKISSESLDDFRISYTKKAIPLVINNKDSTARKDDYQGVYKFRIIEMYIQDVMFKNQVNILAYEEFKKIGVDLTNIVFRENAKYRPYDINELAYSFFLDKVIVTATVVDSIITKRNTRKLKYDENTYEVSQYYKHYILEVNEVIKGKYLSDKFPKRIEVKSELGYDHIVKEDGGLNYKKKMKYLSTVISLEPSEQIIFTISNMSGSKDTIEDFLENRPLWVDTGNIYSQQVLKMIDNEQFTFTIPNIIKLFKNLEKINDTSNFFNRSYK